MEKEFIEFERISFPILLLQNLVCVDTILMQKSVFIWMSNPNSISKLQILLFIEEVNYKIHAKRMKIMYFSKNASHFTSIVVRLKIIEIHLVSLSLTIMI